MLTEDSLALMLSTGEEVAGFEVGGLWVRNFPMEGEPSLPADLWSMGSGSEAWRMHGPGWVAQLWRIHVQGWPEPMEWLRLVETTLTRLRTKGAEIAWMANDHTFADPPFLFHPDFMGDIVFAALTGSAGFVCAAELGKPIAWLQPSAQRTLQAEAGRLVDLGMPDPDEDR